ncbi:hypothetical protein G7Z17_g12436 [Cylindrodendrum hubeiense]|uniref:Transmembrane protein n=1 Tax=Cylindrodendrum hubeiense TaxID=595255 RepID=A0A9P5LAB4_9HYPO|nr:hypothetical protein G7Z17_g12436 [Cylindrodendrum hubeiense]
MVAYNPAGSHMHHFSRQSIRSFKTPKYFIPVTVAFFVFLALLFIILLFYSMRDEKTEAEKRASKSRKSGAKWYHRRRDPVDDAEKGQASGPEADETPWQRDLRLAVDREMANRPAAAKPNPASIRWQNGNY